MQSYQRHQLLWSYSDLSPAPFDAQRQTVAPAQTEPNFQVLAF